MRLLTVQAASQPDLFMISSFMINLTSSLSNLSTIARRFPSGLEVLHIYIPSGGWRRHFHALACSLFTLPASDDWPLSGGSFPPR